MGQRSRKRRRPDPAPTAGGSPRPAAEGPEPAAGRPAISRGYARSRERDEAARASLTPLAPGERPLAVTIAAVVSVLLAISNFAFFAAGWDVTGKDPQPGGVLLFCAILLLAAYGMWRVKYWAVLGFQVLLGITLVYAGLSLLVVSNAWAAVLSVAILGAAGTLFWFLIRAMARIQMPERARRGATPR